jgi:hypothetical protein
MEDFVFCTLHALLRIIEFFVQWVYEKLADIRKITQLFTTMTQEVGVGFKVYEGKKGMKVRSYNGGQCLKILEKIELITALMDDPRKMFTNNWINFQRILHNIQKGVFTNMEGRKVKSAAWQRLTNLWAKQFVSIHGDNSMRIYPHIIATHSLAIVEKFGALNMLSQQGFEAANALHSHFSHHHSDHKFTVKKGVEETNTTDQVGARHWVAHEHSLDEPAKK